MDPDESARADGQPRDPSPPPANDSGTASAADAARTAGTAPTPHERRGRVRGSRTSGVWVGAIVAAILLILLLIFILQNTATVTIHFFGLAGDLPVSVALLFAAVCGVLLVAIPGTVRIVQLRKAVTKAGSVRQRS